jgi:hypothetical protein
VVTCLISRIGIAFDVTENMRHVVTRLSAIHAFFAPN